MNSAIVRKVPQSAGAGTARRVAWAEHTLLLSWFVAVTGGVFAILVSFRTEPAVGLVLADLLPCAFLSAVFRSRWKFLFLVHPIVLTLASTGFEMSFLALGDGPAYRAIISQYLDTGTGTFYLENISAYLSFLDILKYTSLGATPVFLIPEYLYQNPSPDLYYIWQGLFHVLLTAAVVTLALAWRSLDNRHLLPIALFAAVGPSFFDMGAAPTRHIVTFFSVFLFFISYAAARRAISVWPLFGIAIGVAGIMISKAPLLIPVVVFVGIERAVLSQAHVGLRILPLFIAAVGAVLYVQAGASTTLENYAATASEGAATFGKLTQVPVFGWLVKYLFALLSPFPWSKAPFFIDTIYGGNTLLFGMHVASSLLGVYLFAIVAIRARALMRSDDELKLCLLFGLIMSLSILWGAVGFHVYLLIYFPFLAPLFAYREFRINSMLPIAFVTVLEGVLAVAGG